MNTGFDFAQIRAVLERADWEKDPDEPLNEVRRVWLGTIFGITPSGKYYTPFACSNVAGDCGRCRGEGTIAPRMGKRMRARAKRRQDDFARGTIARGGMGTLPGKRYAARVQVMRDAAFNRAHLLCPMCDGCGSRSAALDTRWNEALEKEAERIDAFVEYIDDSIFISQSRDAEDSNEIDTYDYGEAPL
jgi:hypothetical protein